MSEIDEIWKKQAEEVNTIRLDRAEEIQSVVEEEYSGQEEDLQKYAEMSLDEILAAYVSDDRNYVVDYAEIECSEMSKYVHCIKYENGKTKLYNMVNEAEGVERDSIPPEGKPGEIISFGKTIDIMKVRRLHALHAKGASDNGIRFATVSDRECLRNVREKNAKEATTDDGMSVFGEANIISCGNCGILRQEDIAEIEKRMDESIEYGTCYSLIKPVTEWTNPFCTERLVGQCDNKVPNTIYTGGTVNTVCFRMDHHKTMKFDTDLWKKEGLTMLSTLLCTRGGVITIKMHGQIYLETYGGNRGPGKFVGYLAYGAKSITQNPEEGYYMLYDGPTVAGIGDCYMFADIYAKHCPGGYAALQGYGGEDCGLNPEGKHTTYGGATELDTDKGTLFYNGIERHAVAIGPSLQNPDFNKETKRIDPYDMAYGTCLDVTIELHSQTYYIPAVIVDVKAHTKVENNSKDSGYFQTNLGFDGSRDGNGKGQNIVEWYVKNEEGSQNKSTGLKDFNGNGGIIIYRDEVMD